MNHLQLPENDMDKIGIIVLNYNNFEDAINCVDSVIKQENVEMEIVLIDNGSTEYE